MARNWLAAFRNASFRGVPFKVDGEDGTGARRLSISPIAYAETSVIEDMGRDPREMRITAYCAGDSADLQSIALVAALDRKGAGRLVLPMLPPLRARVLDWTLSRQRDYAGYVGIDISFIEEGLSAVPFGGAISAQSIGALMQAGANVLSGALAARTRPLPAPSFGLEASASTRAADRFSAALPLALNGVAKSREIVAAEDAIATAAAAFPVVPGNFAAALANGWRTLALLADPDATAGLMRDAIGAAGAEPATLTGCVETVALAGNLGAAMLRRTYPARQDASAERERLRLAAAQVIEVAGALGEETLALVREATGLAAKELSRIAASRAPLVRVETGISLSAIRSAYELYGDANRAGELVERNRVATAALMPIAFEALSA